MKYLIIGFCMSIGWQIAKMLMSTINECSRILCIKLQKKTDKIEQKLGINNISDDKRSTTKMKIGF